MNRDGIAETHFLRAPGAPQQGEAHVWRVPLPAREGRAAARRALREILGGYLGTPAEAVELTVGEAGKPALAGGPISFNLSHSDELALVAVAAAEMEIGIDVERIRPRRDLPRLAARWLPSAHAEEIAAADGADRETLFYAAWTRYEARTKCLGTGISGPPPGPEIVALQLEIDPGYAAAIAVQGTHPISVRRFDFSD